jgi:hypothetical protein
LDWNWRRTAPRDKAAAMAADVVRLLGAICRFRSAARPTYFNGDPRAVANTMGSEQRFDPDVHPIRSFAGARMVASGRARRLGRVGRDDWYRRRAVEKWGERRMPGDGPNGPGAAAPAPLPEHHLECRSARPQVAAVIEQTFVCLLTR